MKYRVVVEGKPDKICDTLLEAQASVKRDFPAVEYPHPLHPQISRVYFWKSWVSGFPLGLAAGYIEHVEEGQ